MMKEFGIILMIATLLASGCQQTRTARTEHTSVYCPADGVIPLDGRPSDILHYDGRLYVTSFNDRKIWVIDATTGRELQRYEKFDHYMKNVKERNDEGNITGERTERRQACAGDMVIARDKLFVEQVFCNSLLVLNKDTLHPIGRVETEGSGDMIASPDGKKLYFASNSERHFRIIDVMTYEQEEVAYPKGGRGIGSIAVSPDGKRLYLGIQRGAGVAGADAPSEVAGPVNPLNQPSTALLAIYDLVQERYVALKSIGDTLEVRADDSSLPSAFAFSTDGLTLYIAMGQCMAGVHVLDTVSNELRRPITFASMHKGFPWPGCTDIACEDGNIYVTVGSNHELVVLDAETLGRLRVIPIGGHGGNPPGPMAMAADRLYICHKDLRRLFVVAR